MSKISKYSRLQNLFILAKRPHETISFEEMVALLNHTGHLNSEQEFYDALIYREKIISTGIGMGVAIPHAKMPDMTISSWLSAFYRKALIGIPWMALLSAWFL